MSTRTKTTINVGVGFMPTRTQPTLFVGVGFMPTRTKNGRQQSVKRMETPKDEAQTEPMPTPDSSGYGGLCVTEYT